MSLNVRYVVFPHEINLQDIFISEVTALEGKWSTPK